MHDLDRFYEEVSDLTEDFHGKVSEVRKTIALFRVAIEFGATHMGIPKLAYMMSRLLAVTLGVGNGSSYTTYDSILEEFDPEDTQNKTKH